MYIVKVVGKYLHHTENTSEYSVSQLVTNKVVTSATSLKQGLTGAINTALA
jgi:hypothetical protein